MKNLIFAMFAFTLMCISLNSFSTTIDFVSNSSSQITASPNEGDVQVIVIAGIFEGIDEFPGGEIIYCKYYPTTPCYVIVIGAVTDITVDPNGQNIEYNNVSNYSESTDLDGNTTLTIFN